MPNESVNKHLRRIVVGAALVILLIEGYVAIFRRENDFLFHRALGEQFLQGTPYGKGGDWYPLPRVMLNTLIAAPPLRVARAISFLAAVAGLIWVGRIWQRWDQPFRSLDARRTFAAATLAGIVMLPYLLRDLDECGMQLFLLFFLTAGGWALSRGRSLQAGFWLATAAVYKLTPMICLPYLLWKRRWTAAAAMAAWIGVWFALPAVFIGPKLTIACHEQFFARSMATAEDRNAYPQVPNVEPPKVQNQSLAAAVARYLETYPPGHPLVVEHPLFRQFGALDSETAFNVVRGVVLAVAAALAWRFRRSWKNVESDAELPTEWATVCLLCALAAPICWKQHLVVAVPSAYLVARGAMSRDRFARLRFVTLVVLGVAIIAMRHGIVGREAAIALMSYKIDTIGLLVLIAVANAFPVVPSNSEAVTLGDCGHRNSRNDEQLRFAA